MGTVTVENYVAKANKANLRGIPGGPVVRNLSSNAGGAGSIPDLRTKVPHVMGRLRLHALEPLNHERVRVPQQKTLPDTAK